MKKLRRLAFILVILALFVGYAFTQQSHVQGSVLPAAIQVPVTAQVVKKDVPPDLPSDWIPSGCSLDDEARGMTYRLPWAYFGAAPGIDGDPNFGAQFLHCGNVYRALYWNGQYHELSGVAVAGCWYEQHRYWGVTVGVHDPSISPPSQFWIEQWGRDAPLFQGAQIMAGSLNVGSLSTSCTAS